MRVSELRFDASGPSLVVEGDNLSVLEGLPSGVFQMIYMDPPFNTGRSQTRQTTRTVRTESGGRLGFKGQRYETIRERVTSYDDTFTDYWAFLEPRLEQGTAARQEKLPPQQEELVAVEQIHLRLHLLRFDPFDAQKLLPQS